MIDTLRTIAFWIVAAQLAIIIIFAILWPSCQWRARRQAVAMDEAIAEFERQYRERAEQ